MTIEAKHNTAEYWEKAEPADPIYGKASHAGVFLFEELMSPLNISPRQLATDTGLTLYRVNQILNGQQRITVEIALLLAKYFDMSPQFWLNMQTQYEFEKIRGDARLQAKMRRVKVFK